MKTSDWNELIVDTAAVPEPLDDARFRQWMGVQRIFISSVMDGELTPYRSQLRAHLEKFGTGVPAMWETISPRDVDPTSAYLGGVDRSTLLVLILGRSYGVADASGFSPTHHEANRADERHLPKLVFTLPASDAERDGKLNRWLKSLYTQTSAHAAATPEALVNQLELQLRELAARAQRNWIKLGASLFPGRVSVRSDERGARTFTVTAKAFAPEVRRTLLAMNDPMQRGGSLFLTWPDESYPVQVLGVHQVSDFVGEADIEITCRTPQNWAGHPGGLAMNMTINGVGPEEIARRWADHAFFGKPLAAGGGIHDMLFTVRPDGPTLPHVLAQTRATGWQAEGIARLYMVEELARTRGGVFHRLRVGPATPTGVPVEGQFVVDTQGRAAVPVPLQGVVPSRP